MKKILPLLALVILHASCKDRERAVCRQLEKIRDNTAELNAFFSQMPKGGDLHHHFTGSVYAETYINYVLAKDYYIDTVNLRVDTFQRNTNCIRFSQMKRTTYLVRKDRKDTVKDVIDYLPAFKQKLMQKWSVKDYNGVSYPSDKLFFETFGGFGIANNGNDRLAVGLVELKQRAIRENVSYIETMFTTVAATGDLVTVDTSKQLSDKYNNSLALAQVKHDTSAVQATLETLYGMYNMGAHSSAAAYIDSLTGMHERLKMDDSLFTMRYQTYVSRATGSPMSLFKSLVLAFEAANGSPLIVGVNIVAPEDNEFSMRDYWLHMQMFRFCHARYPKVKYAMHAGELTLGIVKPEELKWHINEAVYVAGANRIGHGVDVYHEDTCYQLMQHMAKNNVAVEINLYSNEFILKVKDKVHPLELYRRFKVPTVICTDDAGVLRSDLTHQYVLLASRYKDISYREIKKLVFNSIDHSFIEDDKKKEQLKADLQRRFDTFEERILSAR